MFAVDQYHNLHVTKTNLSFNIIHSAFFDGHFFINI